MSESMFPEIVVTQADVDEFCRTHPCPDPPVCGDCKNQWDCYNLGLIGQDDKYDDYCCSCGCYGCDGSCENGYLIGH